MKVTAKATRSGGWWAIEVPEVPGVFTQAKRLDQVADMVADAAAVMEDVDAATVEVEVQPQIRAAAEKRLEQVRSKRAEARRLDREATAAMVEVAAAYSEENVSMRDIAVILGVSHQRVGQLLQLQDVGVEPVSH